MADDLEFELQRIARDFRCGATASGNERFAALSQTLSDSMGQSGTGVGSFVQRLRGALQMHERGDYIGLADALEYDLLPELKRNSG
jgi:hypothetical protein